jgi:hypothetical protein
MDRRTETKTGRTLEEWLAHIKKAGPKDEKERRAWLKEEHGLGTNTAWWLAERAREKAQNPAIPISISSRLSAMLKRCSQVAKLNCVRSTMTLLKLGLKTGKEAKACPVPDNRAALSQSRLRAD